MITRKNFYQHLAIAFGIIIFLGINRYIKRERDNLQKIGVRNVCLIYTVGSNVRYGDKYCKYYYYVNGMQYEGVKAYDQTDISIKEGDFYEILYNPKKIDYSQINLNKKVPKDSVCGYFDGDCPFK